MISIEKIRDIINQTNIYNYIYYTFLYIIIFIAE